jgi:8-oxo-dGTP diphosphatase
LEETGVTIKNIRFFAVTNDIFEAEGKHYVTIWMSADYERGSAFVAAPEESTEVGWFDQSALPEPLFFPFQNLVSGKHYPVDAIQGALKLILSAARASARRPDTD